LINKFGRGVAASGMLDVLRLGVVWISRITITNFLRIIYSIDWAHAHGRFSNVAKAGMQPAQLWTQK
jgi:hypothetical protein